MAKHLMIDLETLAVSPDAVIVTLGAVHFDPYKQGTENELYLKINLDDQDQLSRSIDQNTLDWWAKQDSAIMNETFSEADRIPLKQALDSFHKFAWGCDAFWSHGATFDLMIIENIYRQLGKPFPWHYWQLRDTRTLFGLGHDPEMPQNNKHNALQDAIRQAIGVQNVYKKLGVKND